MLRNSDNVHITLEKGAQFINENPQIVEKIYKIPVYNDEPKLYHFVSYLKNKYHKNDPESVASGTSLNRNKALLKLFGETVERYALGINDNRRLIKKSFVDLTKFGKKALNPADAISFSDKQLHTLKINTKDLSSIELYWIKGRSLISNDELYVPAQLVFVPYLYQDIEPIIRIPISTGAAASTLLDDAIYKGICECIERDSFMISYFNKINSPQININSLKDVNIQKLLGILQRYTFETHLIDMTTDINIPAVAAIILDKTTKGPAVTVGLKSGFDIRDTIIGALDEAIMLLSWVRDKFIYIKPNYKRKKTIRDIDDRAHFWFSVDSIKYLDFWMNSNIQNVKKEYLDFPENKLTKAIQLLKDKNMEVVYIDLTNEIIDKYGFKVVKVIIPKSHPLHLDEKYPYLGGDRIYNAPVNMGFLKKPKIEYQLNKIPHPFL